MDILKIRGIALFIVAFCLLILSLIVWQKSEKDKTKVWLGFSAFFSGLYAFFCGGTYFFWKADSILSTYWYRTTWLGVFLLPPFIIFTYYFTQNTKHLKLKAFLLYLGAAIVGYIALTTNLFVKYVYLKYPNISTLAGKLDFLGRLYIAICVAIILFYSLREYFKSSGFKKLQLQYFILGVAIFFVTGIITTAIIPLAIGESPYYDITAYASFVWVILTTMAILKYNLFDVKIIATELFTAVIWLLVFADFILANSLRERIVAGGMLIFLLIFGVFLIRSVMREVSQREHLEELTHELEEKNKKLEQLNTLKSQFLSFASHQIKTPIAVVKGFAGLIYDGSYGDVNNKVKDVAGRIKEATDKMIVLLNNFLDLRKIDEGRMEYNFCQINIVSLVKDIIADLSIMARNKNLELLGEYEEEVIKVNADQEKLRQVIQNLAENAIKYTESGFVKIKVTKTDNSVLVEVSDSGRGMSKELLPNLFEQFTRDPQAAKEIAGTGLGLYIAKQITLAHKGQIWAESSGEGKGSQFYVKLSS